MDDPKAGLNKPGAPASAGDEPVIHVIPERFYMAGLKKKVKAEPPKQAAAIPSPAPAGTPSPVPPPKPAKKKGGNAVILVFALVALVLIGGGGAAVYFLTRPQPTPSKMPLVNSAQPPAPAAPVCGDGKCDATESPDTCSADCKPVQPPAPVCGDNKCEGDETAQSCPADCKPIFGQDTDNDGVSDIEETTIYGTNPKDADSDGDTYLDLNEIVNLFDPTNPSPSGLLKANAGIAQYDSPSGEFSLLYPKSWTAEPGDQAAGGVIFKAPTGEFIQVLIVDKPATQNLMDWFLEQNPTVKSSDVQSLKTKQGNDGVLSADRMTAYIGSGAKVVVVSYDLGNQTEINYRATFQMMVRSLVVK